ncbi:MAG: restriction endonuclease [Mycobacterium sp.]|nr:restriction endonuclease [Mycobacterium sp.]
MRSWGYVDAVATTGGSDGGIDVRSSSALAQVKYYTTSPVGRPDLQRLYGARASESTNSLLFFAYEGAGGGANSRQALIYANQTGIGLYTYDAFGHVKALNHHAKLLIIGRMSLTGRISSLSVVSLPVKPLIVWLVGMSLSFALLALVLTTPL